MTWMSKLLGRRQGILCNLSMLFVSFTVLDFLISYSRWLLLSIKSLLNSKLSICLLFIAKAKPQYITYTAGGGKWTVAMLIILCILLSSELKTWWHGYETQSFSIEKGVGHDMQINLDLVVAMSCADVHINVQDAAGDRILAGEKLRRDTTNWAQWVDGKGIHSLGQDEQGNLFTAEDFLEHEDVHDIIANAGGRKTKFAKTPKIKGFPLEGNSCRIYGSLDVNKVQGDFHITARGHGYHEFGTHLDHSGMLGFNFAFFESELIKLVFCSFQFLSCYHGTFIRGLLSFTSKPS